MNIQWIKVAFDICWQAVVVCVVPGGAIIIAGRHSKKWLPPLVAAIRRYGRRAGPPVGRTDR